MTQSLDTKHALRHSWQYVTLAVLVTHVSMCSHGLLSYMHSPASSVYALSKNALIHDSLIDALGDLAPTTTAKAMLL